MLALLLAAAPAGGLTVVDQGGQTLTLPGVPTRIVSLLPSATEILFAIGAQDKLAGVTDLCDFPPEARAKPSVGGMISPNLEALVGLKPDLVVATRSGNRQETLDQVRRLGIPVYLVDATTVTGSIEVVERLAELTSRRATAAPIVASLSRRIHAVTERVAPRRRPRVLYVLWPEPLIVPGRGALISSLIATAGGDSVTAGHAHDYPRYSIEAAVAHMPEVILLASHRGRAPLAREKWEKIASLPAIRSGRLHAVDGDLVHRFGPRVVDGLELLARLIHPDAFEQAASPPPR
ncbi:MAG TPA: cobalamin-binding protein [Candidatus Limnocylindrales bacterium]|nr:cobalamin-binding protein [Candidatus Limnocylindrales bacterium]